MTINNKAARKARNAQVQAGIEKDLGKQQQLQIGGEQFTPSSLEAVFKADSDAMDASAAKKADYQQALSDERAARTRANSVYGALRTFLIGYFGKAAVGVLGDFGMKAPKEKPAKSVATKAVAVAKANATRQARQTKGKVQKKDVRGAVDATAIKAAIETPTVKTEAGTTPGASGTAAPAAPAAPPTPPKPGTPQQQ